MRYSNLCTLVVIAAGLSAAAAQGIPSSPVTCESISAQTKRPKALPTKGPMDPKYTTPDLELQFKEEFPMVVYDLHGRDLADPSLLAEIKQHYEKYGIVHIINNTRYLNELPAPVLTALGFGEKEQFKWGGQFSGRTVRRRLDNNFHAVDAYPAHLPVLAHNEIIYQPVAPRHLLFHYRNVSGINNGGRTFTHSAKLLEEALQKSGEVGAHLYLKLKKHGQLLKTGYIDERHPERHLNYLRSWQVQFDTENIDEAMQKACSGLSYYDRCWKVKLPAKDAVGQDQELYMLMTQSKIPMFKIDERTGEEYFIFPRLGYDGPHLANGFREYLIGDGNDFSVEEMDALLSASWSTRQGIYQKPGDLLIVDNLRFAHSREPYRSLDASGAKINRVAGVLMAGRFYSDDEKGRRLKAAAESDNGNEAFLDPKEIPPRATND